MTKQSTLAGRAETAMDKFYETLDETAPASFVGGYRAGLRDTLVQELRAIAVHAVDNAKTREERLSASLAVARFDAATKENI